MNFGKSALVEQLQEELKSEKDKANELKKQIECPVCLEVPREGPVYACPNGHLVCQKCKRQSCPTCREDLGDNKSLVAVAVIERILHDCKFVECEKEFPLKDIEKHEKGCEHRIVACPNYGGCNERVPLSKLLSHLESKSCSCNRVPIVVDDSSSGFEKYSVSNEFQSRVGLQSDFSWKVTTYSYMGSIMALCAKKFGDNWQFIVVMLESPEVCSHFNIEMEVYGTGSSPDTRFSDKVKCNPCSIDQPEADMTGLGLYVHHRFMEKMISKENSFEFTVTFSFL